MRSVQRGNEVSHRSMGVPQSGAMGLSASFLALLIAGCAGNGGAGNLADASAVLAPTAGHQARGVASLTQEKDRVVIRVHVSGLNPNQEHGIHIHETGDCSAPDASSAGGHWNPSALPHGPQYGQHHAGDLPSLRADGQGVADVNFEVRGAVAAPNGAGLLGKAIVVHASPDDYVSQPAGNSGARIACGVIVTPALRS